VTQHYDPTSLAAWEENATQIIQLDEKLAVKVKTYDVLDLLIGDGQAPNPLMGALQKSMQGDGGGGIGQTLMSDPAALAALQNMLNQLMCEVMISPPLKEQGNEQGISLKQIKLEYKFQIFMELMGGEEGVSRLSRFREEPGASMVVGPAVQTLPDNA
jgi:hypothetical protein